MPHKFICTKKYTVSDVEPHCISPDKKYFVYGYYEHVKNTLFKKTYRKEQECNLFVYFVNITTGKQTLLYKFENITYIGYLYEAGPIKFIFSNSSKYLTCIGSNFDVTRNYYDLHTSRNYLRIYKINSNGDPDLQLTTAYNGLGNNMYISNQLYFSRELNTFYYCDIHHQYTYTIIYKVDFNKSIIKPEIVYKFMNKNNKKIYQSCFSDRLTKQPLNIDNLCATSTHLCIFDSDKLYIVDLITKTEKCILINSDINSKEHIFTNSEVVLHSNGKHILVYTVSTRLKSIDNTVLITNIISDLDNPEQKQLNFETGQFGFFNCSIRYNPDSETNCTSTVDILKHITHMAGPMIRYIKYDLAGNILQTIKTKTYIDENNVRPFDLIITDDGNNYYLVDEPIEQYLATN